MWLRKALSVRTNTFQKQRQRSYHAGFKRRPAITFEPLEERRLLAVDLLGVNNYVEQGASVLINGQTENIPSTGPGPNPVIGAIHDIALHPTDPDIAFLGTVNGGVWRSTNFTSANPLYTPLTDQFPGTSIGALEFDPTDPSNNTLYAGIGRFSSFGGTGGPLTGLLRTTNGGDTWEQVGVANLTNRNISGIVALGNTIVVSANGFSGVGGGVYRSTNGGMTFNFISGTNGLGAGNALDLVRDPTNINRMYVSVAGVGFFFSNDQGATWNNVSAGDAPLNANITNAGANNAEMAVSPTTGRVYATVVINGQLTYVGFSDNQGGAWTQMDLPVTTDAEGTFTTNPNQRPGGQGATHFSIVVDPNVATTVYIGGDRQASDAGTPNSLGANDFSGRLFRGDTTQAPNNPGGNTAADVGSPQWDHLTHTQNLVFAGGGTANNSAPHSDSRDMQFRADGLLVEVDDGGIYGRTMPQNNTGTWISLIGNAASGLQVSEMHDIAYDNLSDILLSGNQDTGSPQQTASGSRVWTEIPLNPPFVGGFGPFPFSTADGGDVAVDNLIGGGQSLRYSSIQNLTFFRRQIYDANNNFVMQQTPALNPGASPALGTQFVTPIAVNEVAANRLVIGGNNGVYESMDRGDNITLVSPAPVFAPPLPAPAPGFTRSGSIIDALAYGGAALGLNNPEFLYAAFSIIDTMAGAPSVLQTVGFFARSAAGMMTQRPAPAGAFILNDIEMDAQNGNIVFTIDNNQIFRSPDGGVTWMDITGNLNDNNLRSIEYIVNPGAGPDAILVGGAGGVFRAFTDNLTVWEEFGTGLPNSIVFDMDYDAPDDVLVLGTLGRGAWTLPNATVAVFGPDDRVLQICGDEDFPNQDDTIRLVRSAGNPAFLDVFINGRAFGPYELALIDQINVFAAGGNDNLIIDSSNGFISVPDGIRYDGDNGCSGQVGAGFGGVDRLTLTQTGGPTITTDTLSVGATAGAGRSTIVGPTGTQIVDFENLEPIIDGVPAPSLVIDGGLVGSLLNADNAINYQTSDLFGATWGQVTIDNFEPIHFQNKTNLTINAEAGSDEINHGNPNTPTGLMTITINGDDPGGSDTLVITATSAAETFEYAPTGGPGEGMVVVPGPDITFSEIELVIIDGQSTGNDDTLIVRSEGGADRVVLEPGANLDSGTFHIFSTAGTESTPPLQFRALGQDAFIQLLSGNLAAREDTFEYRGTNTRDTFSVTAANGGTIALQSGSGGINTRKEVRAPGASTLILQGLDDDDVFNVASDHPFTGGVTLNGADPSGSDSAIWTGTAGNDTVALAVNPTVDVITVTGGNPVNLSGVENLTISTLGGTDSITVNNVGSTSGLQFVSLLSGGQATDTLVANGTAIDDQITYTPTFVDTGTSTAGGNFTAASGTGTLFDFVLGSAATSTFTLNALGTVADEVRVIGTNSHDVFLINTQTVVVGALPARSVTVENALGQRLKTVQLGNDVESVNALGRLGNDTFLVIPSPRLTPPADVPVGAGFTLPINLLVYVDGGQPGASDALVVAGFDGVNATALPATDFAVVNHGLNPGEGVVRIFRDQAGAGNEPFQFPDIVYTGVEVVSPFVSNNAAGDPQLLILGPDAYEQNEFRTTAAFLGSGDTINVTNLSIFPNAFEHRFVVADADFFRVVARHTGTLDVQVYFREVNEFLPGEGDLNIFAFDSTGDAITGFGTNETAAGDNDADERIRIPVVAGQTYFIQVVGRLATTVNGYDMTIINEPPPTPFDLEVDDVIARSTVTSFFNTTTTFNGSAALSAVDDFYNGKFVEFVFPSTVGVTGQRAVVLDYIGATRTFILAAPIAAAPFFGDTFQIESNDTGRSQLDNYTRDNTPTVIIRLDDAILLNDLPGNGATDTPPDQVIPIPFVASTAVNPQGMPGYRVAVFDEADTNNPVFLGYAQPIAGLPGNYTFTFVTPLADGSHFISARVQMIDPATPNLNGFGPRSLSFELVVDTRAPAAFFGQANVLNDGLHPSSEAGVNGQPATFIDNKTNDTTPTFFGVAEANSIIRLYADTNFNNTVDATDVPLGLTVTLPYDGTNQFPFGQWTLTSTVDLNNPLFFPFDGLRRILVTAEDLAGNVSTVAQLPDALNIFIDTQGPQVFDPDGGGPLSGVHLLDDPATPFVNESFFDLFDPKPTTQGPTPPVTKLAIRFRDLPARVAGFLNPALNPIVAVTPGHYELRGDQVGVIPIMSVTFFQDPVVAGFPATGTVVLMFFTPLPDDRYTLTVRDELVDDVGNQLDGESNAIQPLEMPLFPTGDGVPGGDFVARFTVDTRPEIATYAGGQVYVDTNGNFVFDPEGQDNDAVNKDIVYNFGAVSDALFTGKFLAPGVAVPPGTRIFDQLAAYGLFGGVWRFLIDTNSNGVINVAEGDIVANNPFANNALPFAGNWDGNVTNGDEVGLFNGTTWFLDTNHDFIVDRVITGTMAGYPIAGDFDGDGTDDLGTFQNDTFFFDLANNGLFGIATAAIGYGFPGVGERPLAADMDQDGIDDIGLWFPGAQGQPPAEAADWYFLISNDRAGTNRVIGSVNTLNHAFQPVPFGADIFAQFGDEVALPLVGNFDPPVAADSTVDAWVANTNDAIVVAPGPGMEPRIQVFDRHTGQLLDSLLAYAPGFDAGVQVATGDVTGDGVLDIITGAGYGGGPHVRVFDGATGQPVATAIGNFYAYHPAYTGGIFVASADVNRDGRADIVTGTGFGGGPHIRVFSGRDGSVLGEFMAYHPAYTGGVHIGVGDVDGNGFPDIITAPAFDGGPHVKIFSTPQGQIMPGPLGNFMVYSPAFTGGVWVAAGDIDGDRRADLITGAGAGGGPHVRAFRSTDGGVLQSFFAYDGAFTGGVRVAAVDVNYDGRADIVTGPGMGGGPHVRAFDGQTHDSPMSLFAYDAGFTGGVYVAGSLFGVPGSALLAAGGGVESTADSVAASQDEVDLLAAAAIARWSATGLSQDQVDRLRGVSIRIADLPGAHLGVAYEDEILIDIDAAGHGWFVDATPEADEEFLLDSYGNLRLADPALSGRMDLLTVLAHEMGHVLGLEDIDLYGDASELMGDELSTALRRDVPGSETDSVDLVFQSGLWE